MKFATSASGRQIPMLGLGTWQLTGDTVAEAVRTALSLGYRHIDTAEAYRNQRDIARGIAASGLARDELFITTKVFREHLRYDQVLAACESTLRDLNTSYIDLSISSTGPNPNVPMAEDPPGAESPPGRGAGPRHRRVQISMRPNWTRPCRFSASPITANRSNNIPT
jgi:diketogulonate reductase-like aldo/keto reductase